MMGSGTKTCVLCGIDCAGKPRVKDSKGRYYCKACHERAAARHQSQQDDMLGGAMLDELLGSPQEPAASPCPGCGQPLADSAMLCVNCGFNRQTGQALTTEAIAMPRGGGSSRTAWPIVIGIVCLCWGGLQVLIRGLDLLIILGTKPSAGGLVAPVIAIILGGYLIVGAIQLMTRSQRGPATLQTWSRIAIVLSLIGLTCVGIAFAAMSGDRAEHLHRAAGTDSELELAAIFIVGSVLLVVQIAWAAFLLIWFRRDQVQREVASW